MIDHTLTELASLLTRFSASVPTNNGGAAMAAVDVDGDALPEIVTAEQSFDSSGGQLTLKAYDYTPPQQVGGQGALSALDQPDPVVIGSSTGKMTTVKVIGADVDGDSVDEIALLWSSQGTKDLKLKVFEATLDGSGALILTAISEVAVGHIKDGSFADLSAGLLSVSAGNIFKRQIVTVHVSDDAGRAQVQLWDGRDPQHDAFGLELAASYDAGPSAFDTLGPGVAVSNYVGLAGSGSLTGQVAVNVPTVSDPGFYPRLVTLRTTENDQHEINGLELVDDRSWSDLNSVGVVWAQEPVAYDRDGDSVFLGAPTHYLLEHNVLPQVILQEPPKHVDYLPVDPSDWDGQRKIFNVSGFPEFQVVFEDSTGEAFEHQSTHTSDWTIGGGLTTSASVSSSLGIGKLKVETTAGVEYAYDRQKESTSGERRTLTKTWTIKTTSDDYVQYTANLIDVWRYPLIGVEVDDLEGTAFENGYFELVVPGEAPVTAHANGQDVDWYRPQHSNTNILSYPQIQADQYTFKCDGSQWPADVGSYTDEADGTVCSPMNSTEILSWGNEITWSLQMTESTSQSTKKSWQHKLSENADVKTSFSAKAKVPIINVGESFSTSVDVNFSNSNSWGQSTVTNESIDRARGISLHQPAGAVNQDYRYLSYVYAADDGHLKVAHAVDIGTTAASNRFWTDYYSRPDPGLALPQRFMPSFDRAGAVDWQPTRPFGPRR
ncbi:MAG: hypothetical protein AAFX50_08455, partial [Acidobacteriota bacterium]